MRKGSLVTAGSKILENFISPFDATVVTRLLDNNRAIAGKTKMNEFGIDRISADRPDDVSESIKVVADGAASFSLCNDVFGQCRRQAAERGVFYIHPTYGTVSRYGLIPLASSMDQIGVACKNLADGFKLLSVIAGNDPNDGAMFPEKNYSYAGMNKKITLGVPSSVIKQADENAQKCIRGFAEKFNFVNIALDYFDVFKQTMYILGCAEISSNLTRYDGIKFGYRASNYKGLNDLYVNTRTEAFGLEAKLAAIMGSMVLSRDQYVPYYEKAMKMRRLIKESLRFDEYDVIVLPTAISENPYENLSLFSLAPLAGLPSVSFSWQGGGIQLIADTKNENALITALEAAQ
jgi:aspartyl-tRNA(Asn)/glutamyl-tRNA(Gln) amidotransferase subunit A